MEEKKNLKEEIAEEKLNEVSGGSSRIRKCQKCGDNLPLGCYSLCRKCSAESKSQYNDRIL